MLTVLYIVLTISLLLITVQALSMFQRNRTTYLLILLLVLVGLMYDNLIIAIGSFLGEGELLKNLNAGRFIIHAFLTPLMIIFGFGVLQATGVKWAQEKIALITVYSFTILLIGLGIFSDVIQLDLHPRNLIDTLRYVNEGGLKGPPIPAILTIIYLIIAGVIVWRKTGFQWLAIGSLLMFIAAAIGMGELIYVGNIGEVILGFANLITAKKFLSTENN